MCSYLVLLGSRKKELVLDPFAGTGTTGLACILNERNFFMVEANADYFRIMDQRTNYFYSKQLIK